MTIMIGVISLCLGYILIIGYFVLFKLSPYVSRLQVLPLAALALGFCAVFMAILGMRRLTAQHRTFKPQVLAGAAIVLCYFAYSAPGWVYDFHHARWSRTRSVLRDAAGMIQDYHEEHGRLPHRLEDMKDHSAWTDPYCNEKGLVSWQVFDSTSGILFSVGPDGEISLTPDGKHILYDPTNGIRSRGDIVHPVF